MLARHGARRERARRASTCRRTSDDQRARHGAVQPVPQHHRARVRRHALGRARASRARTSRRRTWTCSRSPRVQPATDARRARSRSTWSCRPTREPPFGLVLNQDVGNFAAHPARPAPARPHAPHGVAHRGVPRGEPAPHARGAPGNRPRGWLTCEPRSHRRRPARTRGDHRRRSRHSRAAPTASTAS